jgi:hypothetical protein
MSIQGKVSRVPTRAITSVARIALRLADDGTNIAVIDLYDDKIQVVAEEIRNTGRKAKSFKTDVSYRPRVYAAITRPTAIN